MLDMLILFLRDLARQKYESFVVFNDIASLDASNLNVNEGDIARGHFWDKQWFIEGNQDLNKLSVNFPLLGIERDVRKLNDANEAIDYVWVVLAVSKDMDGTTQDDATKSYLFNELSKILVTLNDLNIVSIAGGSFLKHSSQGGDVLCHNALLQEGEIEIFPTDVGNNKISAVSAKIMLRSSVTGFGGLQNLSPLVTDILPKSCC